MNTEHIKTIERLNWLNQEIKRLKAQLDEYNNEIHLVKDEIVKDIRWLKDTVQLAGYIVVNWEIGRVENDLIVELSEDTQFAFENLHAVKRKLNRFNIDAYRANFNFTKRGGGWVTHIKVKWQPHMTKDKQFNQAIETGIESPPMTAAQIKAAYDAIIYM